MKHLFLDTKELFSKESEALSNIAMHLSKLETLELHTCISD